MEVEQLTYRNLQNFCRLCLRNLGCNGYNIHQHNLAAILKLYTTLDIAEESAAFPRSLCQLCYDSLNSFKQFQNVALQSTKVLYELMSRAEHENAARSAEDTTTDFAVQRNETIEVPLTDYVEPTNVKPEIVKTECAELEIGRADHNRAEEAVNSVERLLLPEMPLVDDHAIKTEPDEFEQGNTFSLPSIKDVCSEYVVAELAKAEIDSEYDEDEDSSFYERNALAPNYDSIADDADDEENALCNDAANTCTTTLNNPSSSTSKQCKRDRSKKALKTLEIHRQVAHTAGDLPFSLDLQEVIKRHQIELSQEMKSNHLCNQCCRKYSSKRALAEHLKRHAQFKEYVCKVCGTAKVTRTELQTHMRTHEPNLEKFKCSICPQEFNHKNAISRHVRVVHEGQRRYACTFCSKRFGTRNAQVRHERLHTGERLYSCKLCSKTFAQADALKSHMKNHDTKLRKHICSYCARRFITRKNLVDHESRHRSSKPHICDVCNQGYFQHADLVQHRKVHDDNIVDTHK